MAASATTGPAPYGMIRATGRTCCCGAIVEGGVVVDCAPYLRAVARRRGWDGRDPARLASIARGLGWVVELLP